MTAFLSEASLLLDGKPLEVPPHIDKVFAVIDTAVETGKKHDGIAVVYFCFSKHIPYAGTADPERPWVGVLDWDLTQVGAGVVAKWMQAVFERLDSLAVECKARIGSAGIYIENERTGMVLLEQAKNHGWNAQVIDPKFTAMGKSERTINISGYVHRGDVKISRHAYEKVVAYKAITKNHLLSQILAFRVGTKQTDPAELLGAFCAGVFLALEDPF